jgi:hypothetical protein
MRDGKPDEAIGFYNSSLATDPRMVCNRLSLAAAYLEKHDEKRACAELGQYVAARPGQFAVRCRYADLLVRTNQRGHARAELERLVADLQEDAEATQQYLIRAHSRLMELAEDSQDLYEEHLHRGIGLFLLARKRSALGDYDGELPPEGLFCKAAAQLTEARLLRPAEARPHLYLFEIWSKLGQRLPAISELRDAHATAPFSNLTPAEQRNLHFAYARYESELLRK